MKNIITKPNGLTIKELKDILKDLPENDKTGEPYEVWMMTNRGLSSPISGSDILFGVEGV